MSAVCIQLGGDGPVDGVVDPLVHRRLDVPVRLAELDYLCDFPSAEPFERSIMRSEACDLRHIVADAEPLELSLLV